VIPERLLYLLIDESNYTVFKYLEGNELISSIQSPNHLIFCLQIPDSQGGEPVLAEFKR
jgi:hypothetical protein